MADIKFDLEDRLVNFHAELLKWLKLYRLREWEIISQRN